MSDGGRTKPNGAFEAFPHCSPAPPARPATRATNRDGRREQTLREYISVLAELGEPGIPYAQCDLGRVTSRDEASGGTSHDRPVEGPHVPSGSIGVLGGRELLNVNL